MLSPDKQHLSLAFCGLTDLPVSVAQKYGSEVRHLDLTGNMLRGDFLGLNLFPKLDTLVLDDNGLDWRLRLPHLPCLSSLSFNKNEVENLSAFLDRLVQMAPNLRYLSMLQNPCCLNFLNGGTPQQYRDYRLFVISRIPNIKAIDSSPVTDEERDAAQKEYGALSKTQALLMFTDSASVVSKKTKKK